MKKVILLFFFTAMGIAVHAQIKTGNNPTTMGNGQLLELERSGNRGGLKIAEAALTSATDVSTINIANTAVGTMIWNTATAGTSPNSVTPGFYVWNGAKWDKVITASSSSSSSGIVLPSGDGTTGVMVIQSSFDGYSSQQLSISGKFELTSLTSVVMNTIGGTITNDDTYGDYISLPTGFYQVFVKYSTEVMAANIVSWVDITSEPINGGGISVLGKMYRGGVLNVTNGADPSHVFEDVFEISNSQRVRFRPALASLANAYNSNASYTWKVKSFTMPPNVATTPPLYNVLIILKKIN